MAGNKRALARLEREMVACLTDACATAQAEIVGFAWLTHQVDLDDFPASLRITWVFSDDTAKAQASVLVPVPAQAVMYPTRTRWGTFAFITQRQKQTKQLTLTRLPGRPRYSHPSPRAASSS